MDHGSATDMAGTDLAGFGVDPGRDSFRDQERRADRLIARSLSNMLAGWG